MRRHELIVFLIGVTCAFAFIALVTVLVVAALRCAGLSAAMDASATSTCKE